MNDKSSPVLVTGGAGYIGSHVLLALQDTGIDAVVIDDLSRGRRELVPDGIPLVVGDAGNQELVGRLLRESGARSVIHLAGDIVVPESVAKPLQYYRNNVETSRNLIEACVSEGVLSFVFSSTAAVYGSADGETVSETAPLRPESPYARSKLMVEWILDDVSSVSDLRYAAFALLQRGRGRSRRENGPGRGKRHASDQGCLRSRGRPPRQADHLR